ncbi:MAG: hypothetical protein J0L80_07500 [Chitinophagales bacterium]|nr:hypothetical protein [Chitinophagales bacterium]
MNSISLKKWTLSTFLGWLLSVVFILILSGIFDGLGIEGYQFYLGISVGLGVGLTQWLRLRKYSSIGIKWVWYTALGAGLPFLIFDLVKIYGHVDFGERYLLYSVSVGGLSVGIMQYLLLKPYSPKAINWIPLSLIGWVCAALTVTAINSSMEYIKQPLLGFIVNLSLILAGGIVLGLITGSFIAKTKFVKNA